MPREIEKCPKCGSIEQLVDYKIDLNYKWCEHCEERFIEEECSEIIYTQSEVNEAVKQAYENSALICDEIKEYHFNHTVAIECAEAIRQRCEQ